MTTSLAQLLDCTTRLDLKECWLSLTEAERVELRRSKLLSDHAWTVLKTSPSPRSRHRERAA